MASSATIKDVKRPQRTTQQSRITTILPPFKAPRRSDRIQKKANGPKLGYLRISQNVFVQKDTGKTKDCEKERPVGNRSEVDQQSRSLSPGHTLKHGKIGGRHICSGSSPENTPAGAQDGSSQDSDPIRPAKRRGTGPSINILHQSSVSACAQPRSKRARLAIVTNSRGASESERTSGVKYKDEVRDSYEEEPQLSAVSSIYLAVEIPVYEDFDRDAYAKFSASSSQSTTTSTAPQGPKARSPIIVIPDSQEQLYLSSYEAFQQDSTTQSTRRGQALLSEHFDFDENEIEDFSQEREVSRANVAQDSNSAEAWQGAQIVQALLISNSQNTSGDLDFEIFKDSPKRPTDQPAHLPHELSQGASDHSVLSQREPNSQQSARHTGSSHSKRVKENRHRASRDGQSSASLRRPSSSVDPRPSCSGSNRIFMSRPPTPLASSMADAEAEIDGTKLGYIDELRAARNKVRAAFKGSQRFPSVDAESPPALSQISGQMLPMRENVTDAAVTMEQMDETADNDDNRFTTLGEVTLRLPKQRPMESIILLPIVSMVREIYESVVMKRKREIQEFLSNDKMDPTLVEHLDAMIEELKLLVDHQDLITEESFTQLNISDEYRAKWATTCSTKCLFIHSLLERMRQEEKHIAILARPGRMLDILESILRWYKFSYERIGSPIQPGARGTSSLKVTLLPTRLTGEEYRVNRADAVIVFDETFREAERYFTLLRGPLSDSQTPTPLISLVVAYSAEHIELCLPTTADPVARKISLVDFITQTREDVGKLDDGFPSVDEAAAAIAQYLHGDTSGESVWPLPEIPDITGLEPSSNPVTQKASGSQSQLYDTQSSRSVPPHGPMKRTLRAESIAESDPDLTKRMRMTPTPGGTSSSGDVTRVSDSFGSRSQVKPATPSNAVRDAIAHAKELNNRQSKQISSLVEKVGELEAKVLEKESAREHLTRKVKDLEHRLDDHISTIKRLQPRLQEAIIERGKFQAERDEAKAQAANVAQAITSRNAEIAKLKEDKMQLEKELVTTRTALTSSTLPDAAILAQAEGQARALQSDKDRLGKRISSLQHELDFTREVYQKASSHTTQLDRKVSELQEVNTVLQRKASENTVRIAEIQRANESREREARIAELEALLRDREAELRKKSEELKVKTNGRRETRGTSVPRSPRMGTSGAMSPRPGFARVTGGSRGASPAPGDYAHTGRERDPLLFPPSGLGNARWGHLSG